MTGLVHVPLDGGGYLLLESADAGVSGRIKAGRAADAVVEMRDSLRSQLRPVVQASREMLQELRGAGPDEVTVEFGVVMTAAAGALIAKAETGFHFKVTVRWAGGPVPENSP
ncbi:CU044_2847 family protein [Actinoplanes siamensis]|uniref:Trypsin-co-occurring domain-containing protein n=1 Tax=Actinoplanes siamensis TaxID=1223317 RepID=A0A919N650_9ACTN|nr:CU044_2847 family protein [Actinoplanes siamensis]GIF05024.1 hypothetical protein Asi03nite_25620 [Actinoplanes siamensis]